jgi:hypothetical protein
MRSLLQLISLPLVKSLGKVALVMMPVGLVVVAFSYVMDSPQEDPPPKSAAGLVADAVEPSDRIPKTSGDWPSGNSGPMSQMGDEANRQKTTTTPAPAPTTDHSEPPTTLPNIAASNSTPSDPSPTTTTKTTTTTTTPTTTTSTDSGSVGGLVFPADAGLVNVHDYGAKGDGSTDDTAAIRRAIRENVGKARTLYFPAGTYLVSGALEWRDGNGAWQPWLSLQGQGRDLTTIKLANGSAEFGNSSNPQGVIVTGSGDFRNRPSSGGRDHQGKGEGAEAFKGHIFDLTVDTGRNNPGAMGIDFLANNSGSVVNVTIRSGDGRGSAGLSMTRRWPGPALVENVRVEGFDYGVKTSHTEYGLTFEHLVLVGQWVAAIHNDENVLSIRKLTSDNKVPVIQNVSSLGLVVLLDGDLRGGSANLSAVENHGQLYLRNVVATGYKSVVSGRDGKTMSEFATSNVSPEPYSSLGLPVEETPDPGWADLSDWANVTDSKYAGGADPFDFADDTAAIQTALDSGRSTIYFPSAGLQGLGRYYVGDTLHVPASVERIIGFDSFIAPIANNRFQDSSRPRALVRIEGGSSNQVVVMERFRFGRHSDETPGVVWIEQASPRTLVVKHTILGGGDHLGYRGLPNSGALFIEDLCCSNLQLNNSGGVWARQLNIERNGTMIRNQGSRLWILGIKTERPSTVIETTNGGQTELLGGLLYPVQQVPADRPAFISDNADHSLIYAVSAYNQANRNYGVQIEEIDDQGTNRIMTDDVPMRKLGSVVIR